MSVAEIAAPSLITFTSPLPLVWIRAPLLRSSEFSGWSGSGLAFLSNKNFSSRLPGTLGLGRCVSTASTDKEMYSTLQPYATGTSLTTVWRGTSRYGNSSAICNYEYLDLQDCCISKFLNSHHNNYRKPCPKSRQEGSVTRPGDQQPTRFLDVPAPW